MINSFSDLLDLARELLSPNDFQDLLADNPRHHAPLWHVYGVLGHMFAVYEASLRLARQTGIDVRQAALYHDLGKLYQFPDALALYNKGKESGISYAGHELKSAGLALSDGLRINSVAAVACHDLAYQGATPEKIITKLGNKLTIVEWLVLSASDAAGKGFTRTQLIQRRAIIPDRFRQVAHLAGIESTDPVLVTCCDAVINWQPSKPPQFN